MGCAGCDHPGERVCVTLVSPQPPQRKRDSDSDADEATPTTTPRVKKEKKKKKEKADGGEEAAEDGVSVQGVSVGGVG